jgi:hypothetical protein
LERLSAEYDYLAQIAAAEDLVAVLERHSPGLAPQLQDSPSWGATVTAWRRSVQVSRPSSERVAATALSTSGSAKDVAAAVMHSRLRSFVSGMPIIENNSLESIYSSRPDLTRLIQQVQARMRSRMDHVSREAIVCDTEWKRNILERMGPEVDPAAAHDVVCRVAMHRDRWGLGDSPLPLGPVPSSFEWEQQEQHVCLGRIIDQGAHPPATQRQDRAWADAPPNLEDRLINVGWQL